MPFLAAILVVVCMSGAAVFTFFISGSASEKYETSLLQAQWETIDKSAVQVPQIIHVQSEREYVVLAEPYKGEVLLTLMNPEDDKSVRTFPSDAYVPSRAAVALAKATPQASTEVVRQLSARVK
ncbi:hypothetical protein [Diaphorobacter aerolatus]|uniref:Uncharacterized protein n=1 Tax=Diaphorobacter aerolatus TaxID=1288495 RepID=A0A7H0GHW7_9BURK|nr:hypothetical protein [Diaphorobacter aerolatus]QNP47883.1 hypothetical protein H9K75_17365 [Diaphorobacter aerolatus]